MPTRQSEGIGLFFSAAGVIVGAAAWFVLSNWIEIGRTEGELDTSWSTDSQAWQWDAIHALTIIAGIAGLVAVALAFGQRPRRVRVAVAVVVGTAVLWIAGIVIAAVA